MYKPNYPYSATMLLITPTYTTSHGVTRKIYDEKKGKLIKVSFKTYGGTETTNNNVYTIIDTAIVETWFRTDITSDCHLKLLQTGVTYEIIGNVENIDMRNQFLKFKVKTITGGA